MKRHPIVLEWDEDSGRWIAWFPDYGKGTLKGSGGLRRDALWDLTDQVKAFNEFLVEKGKPIPEPYSRSEIKLEE